jgi:hypothetical protein
MTLAGQKRPPATLAMQCAICHGPPAAAFYKQLRDFKTGARTNAVMGPLAVKLSEQDMLDLAAYYSYLPRQPGSHPDPAAAVPQIVARGAPMPTFPLAPLAVERPTQTSVRLGLTASPTSILRPNSRPSRPGARRNDISEQMRNIARQMTPAEIDEAARFYASRP